MMGAFLPRGSAGFDFVPRTQGLALAEQGAQRAADHADRKLSLWSEQAYAAFLRIGKRMGVAHTDTIRRTAEAEGLPPPPDGRAWGFVAMAMRKAGHVLFAGYAPAKSSNGSPKCLWRYW